MHISAMRNGADFFANYCANLSHGTVLDIGSQDVNGSLRQVCPSHLRYIGVDFVAGRNVDVILEDPYKLPFEDNHADAILSSSCFEHSEMFWLVFLEVMRVLKPSGIFYLSAPANGAFHRYPVDCWRFYPDSGGALVTWARRNGLNAKLLESYTSLQDRDIWNDFTAVFLKDASYSDLYPKRISNTRTDVENVIRSGHDLISQPQAYPEDQRNLMEVTAENEKLSTELRSRAHQNTAAPQTSCPALDQHSGDGVCPVCGGTEFASRQVLWPDLINAWDLSGEETAYVNEQQATICTSCGSNVRSMALAVALREFFDGGETLTQTVADRKLESTSVLEVNEAGTLHRHLAVLPGHQFASYPEFDLTNLSFANDTFDAVIHSDTLEHIPNPDLALKECWRVLKPGGALLFTVPIILGRLTRSTQGSPKSFHGSPGDLREDMAVHTEFGADVWTNVMRAGFRRCEIFSFRFPAGISMLARK